VEDSVSLLTISVVHLPAKDAVKQEQSDDVHSIPGRRFVAGGDPLIQVGAQHFFACLGGSQAWRHCPFDKSSVRVMTF
jgi:hypothetical protein